MTLSRKSFLAASFVLAAAGLVTGALGANHLLLRPTPRSLAVWKDVYRTPGQLVRGVDAIAVATAVDVRPGRTATSENGEDVLHFELVDFDVIRGVKGIKTAERITVERTAASEGGLLLDADGGGFEIGQSYLLFLKLQGEGPNFLQVNDQGRYRIANGRLDAAAPGDEVAIHFQDQTLEDSLDLVRAALAGRAPRIR